MQRIFVLVACLALAASPAFANGNGQGNGNGSTHHNNTADASTSVEVGGGSVSVEGDDDKRQASSATAPGLAASEEACMGSTSFGASSPFGGLSFGTTWKNIDCERRKYSMLLRHYGHQEAALALLALNSEVAAVLDATGVKYAKLETDPFTAEPVAAGPVSVDYGMDFEEDQYSLTE